MTIDSELEDSLKVSQLCVVPNHGFAGKDLYVLPYLPVDVSLLAGSLKITHVQIDICKGLGVAAVSFEELYRN